MFCTHEATGSSPVVSKNAHGCVFFFTLFLKIRRRVGRSLGCPLAKWLVIKFGWMVPTGPTPEDPVGIRPAGPRSRGQETSPPERGVPSERSERGTCSGRVLAHPTIPRLVCKQPCAGAQVQVAVNRVLTPSRVCDPVAASPRPTGRITCATMDGARFPPFQETVSLQNSSIFDICKKVTVPERGSG